MAGGIIISTEPDEYVIVGTGLIVTFALTGETKAKAGILGIQEGTYSGSQRIQLYRYQ